MGARVREDADLVVVDPDAVGEDHVLPGVADGVQVAEVAHVDEAFHIGALALVF